MRSPRRVRSGCRFIGDFDADRRRDAVEQMLSLLSVMAEIDGAGAMTPASWGMFSRRLPPFAAPRSPAEDRRVLLDGLTRLGEHAEREGVEIDERRPGPQGVVGVLEPPRERDPAIGHDLDTSIKQG